MKSIQIQAFSDNLQDVRVTDAAIPEPGPGQVRVKMLYSPINPSDFNFIRGTYHKALGRVIWNHNQDQVCFDPDRGQPCPTPPYALGGEGVGIVDATGSGLLAKRLKGKRVAIAAGPPDGAWQEYTVVEARKAIPVPASIPDEQAAMFFVNPLSAYIMLHEVLQVKPGSWLIQTAAGSALGKSVVRMSKKFGFKTINIVRTDANTAELKSLGADVVIETSTQDVLDEVHRATEGKGAAYALDSVGGPLAEEVVRCLGLDGRMLVYGTLADQPINLPSRDLMMPVAHISGFYVPNWLSQQSPLKLLGILRNLKKLTAQGMFTADVSQVFDMDNIHEALESATTKGRTGKTLLKLS